MAPHSSITKRWLLNSFGIIVVIMVAMVIAVSAAMHSFYYNSASQYIRTRAAAVSARLESAAADAGSDFNARLYELVQDFEYRDRIELMALDAEGQVFLTSSGFMPQDTTMPDLAMARENGESGSFTGRWEGQKIMAVTVLSSLSGEDLLGLRYVVSMQAIDRQLTLITVFAALVALAILLFVLYTSSYFMNSIIAPVGEVSRTARQIAQGDFDVRLDTHNDDEIGQLCASINNMAEELSNAEQVKNDFISSVSHELRTPLTAIRGWGETLLSDDDLDPETRRKGMQVIMGETERLSQMVEELLDFSRIQGGRMVLTRENVDLAAELSDVVLMYTERARRENKTLLYEEPEGVIIVYADRNRLRQVFINVIDNAIKYSHEEVKIDIICESEKGFCKIKVCDNGLGIPLKDQSLIFNRFERSAAVGRSGRGGAAGFGLGLNYVQQVMLAHGGRVEVESEEGCFSEFTLYFPIETV